MRSKRNLQARRELNQYKLHFIRTTPLLVDDLLKPLISDAHTQSPLYLMTNYYESQGLVEDSQLTLDFVKIRPQIDENKGIVPSFFKMKEEKKRRASDKGEVATPEFIVRAQMSLIDAQYWGGTCPFNSHSCKNIKEHSANLDPIPFNETTCLKTWEDYVLLNRLEIACGESPYIVSRYCAQSGAPIDVQTRSGVLDRKLRVVSENIHNENDWFEWATAAVKCSYGYEYQGDNLFLARQNIVYSVLEHYEFKFHKEPPLIFLYDVAYVSSWNFVQLDGLTFKHPLFIDNDVYTYNWKEGQIESWSSQPRDPTLINKFGNKRNH